MNLELLHWQSASRPDFSTVSVRCWEAVSDCHVQPRRRAGRRLRRTQSPAPPSLEITRIMIAKRSVKHDHLLMTAGARSVSQPPTPVGSLPVIKRTVRLNENKSKSPTKIGVYVSGAKCPRGEAVGFNGGRIMLARMAWPGQFPTVTYQLAERARGAAHSNLQAPVGHWRRPT